MARVMRYSGTRVSRGSARYPHLATRAWKALRTGLRVYVEELAELVDRVVVGFDGRLGWLRFNCELTFLQHARV